MVPHDLATAHWYGKVKAALKRKGRPIPENDIWIAATAIVAGMTLLTTDKDFLSIKRVAALDVRVLDGRTGLVQ